MTVIVLGIDPGTANTGFGVVLSSGQRLAALDGGVINTDGREPLERRLTRIHARVCDLIREHTPQAVAIEDLFFGTNARSAFSVGQARGVVMLSAGMRGVPCYSYTPQAVAIEDLFFGNNARSAFSVGQARGAVMLTAGMYGVPCYSYTPQAVKQAVCGTGRAEKGQVQRMVQALLSLTEVPEPDHAADALAVAICHANGAPMRAAV